MPLLLMQNELFIFVKLARTLIAFVEYWRTRRRH